MINKFTAFGEAVVAASMLVLECPDNTIHLGPAIKGLLPGIYKVANHKKVLKSMNSETFLIYHAPFSYLTLYCLIVNESSGPKRVKHHIFYSVHIHISKHRVILTIPHRISNPKSLISLQPTKAFMRLS